MFGRFEFAGMEALYPTGVPLDFFNYRLDKVTGTQSLSKGDAQLSPEIINKFLANKRYMHECEEYYEIDPQLVAQNLCKITHRAIPWNTLTENDLFRLYASSIISNPVSDRMSHDQTIMPIWKVSNSMWRNGYGSNYNQFVDHVNHMLDFKPELPDGFSIKLDIATYCNDRGYSMFKRKFIDGSHAYIIHYKDKPVYIVSFSFCDDMVVLEQLQAMSSHGNRWMYKLPQPAHIFFAELIIKHFPTVVLRASANRKARWMQGYSKDNPNYPSQELISYVNKVYDSIEKKYKKAKVRDLVILKMPKAKVKTKTKRNLLKSLLCHA